MRLYQAGPLFSDAERQWHLSFKQKLEAAGHTVVWPGELISQADVTAWGADAPRRIMQIDSEAILACIAVVALLDGAQVDDGTAWEIGYAYAKGIPVVGIRTDFRVCSDSGHEGVVNAMIQGSVVGIAKSVEEALEMVSSISSPDNTPSRSASR